MLYRKQGKLVDAEKMLRGAIDNMREQPNADYPYQLGVVVASQGELPGVSQADRESKYNESINQFQEAIKLNPEHYKAYFRQGVLFEKLDQPQKADTALRKAIELRPNYSPSFVTLGNMYIDYGHANVGQAVLEIGTKINDKDAAMWNGLGRAYAGDLALQDLEHRRVGVGRVDVVSELRDDTGELAGAGTELEDGQRLLAEQPAHGLGRVRRAAAFVGLGDSAEGVRPVGLLLVAHRVRGYPAARSRRRSSLVCRGGSSGRGRGARGRRLGLRCDPRRHRHDAA